MSERRACTVVGVGRSILRYRPHRRDNAAPRTRLRELAFQRKRFGYRRLHALLQGEGRAVNHKRVARLYREGGLAVRRHARHTSRRLSGASVSVSAARAESRAAAVSVPVGSLASAHP